ncbi:unnamed protein product [Moneuplotes crassus]|uniref:Uncharacterized protein n=1 Tax=Euplotes crassus TaxID=5936 RepID=A0AAD1XAE3_EUPCR|nr:unnamed protein product [Moneuplotes crassus]
MCYCAMLLTLFQFILQKTYAQDLFVTPENTTINTVTSYGFRIDGILSLNSPHTLQVIIPEGVRIEERYLNDPKSCSLNISISGGAPFLKTHQCTYIQDDLELYKLQLSSEEQYSYVNVTEISFQTKSILTNPDSVRFTDYFKLTTGPYHLTSHPPIIYSPATLISLTVNKLDPTPSTPTTMRFHFQPLHPLPSNSCFKLTYPPTTSFTHPTQTPVASILLDSTSISTFSITHDQLLREFTVCNLFESRFIGEVTVEIEDLTNPGPGQESGVFKVTTLVPGEEGKWDPVDERSERLAKEELCGVIEVKGVEFSTKEVDQEMYVTISGFGWVRANGDSLRIYGDWNSGCEDNASGDLCYKGEESPNCTMHYGFVNNSAKCSYHNGSEYYLELPGYNERNHIYTVGPFQNPLGAIKKSFGKLQVYDQSNTQIMQQLTENAYTTIPRTINVSSAKRNSELTQVALTANYTLSFINPTRMLSDSTITLIFPSDQVGYNSGTACFNGSNNLGCTLSDSNSTHFQTTIAQWCNAGAECAAGSTLSFTLANAMNPSWVVSPLTSSVIIKTTNVQLTGSPTIDQITSGVQFSPTLTPGTLTSFSVTKDLATNKVGEKTSYNITFAIVTAIPADGKLVLTFPSAAVYNAASTKVTCKNSAEILLACSNTSDFINNIKTRIITCTCTSECAALSTILIQLEEVYNPGSTNQTSTSFEAQTKTTEGYMIDTGPVGTTSEFILIPNSFTSVTTNSPTASIVVGAITEYKFTIVLKNAIPSSGGKLVVIFPSQLAVQSGGTCTAVISSTSHTCAVSNDDNTVTVTFNSDAAASSSLEVAIMNGIKNPTVGQQSDAIIFKSTVTGSSTTYDIDEDLTSIKIQPNVYGELKEAYVQRLNNTLINSDNDLEIKTYSSNEILSKSTIKIEYPFDQVQLSGNIPSGIDLIELASAEDDQNDDDLCVSNLASLKFYKMSDTGMGDELCPKSITSNTTHLIVIIQEWCSDGMNPCLAEKANVWFITTGLKNPPNPVPPKNSFGIFIDSKEGYIIDGISSGLYTTPDISPGNLSLIEISRNSSYVGDITNYTVKFETQISIKEPNGVSLYLTFPLGLLYQEETLACTFNGNDVSSECNAEYCETLYGKGVKVLRIPMNCPADSCGVESYNVTFVGFRNPFSTDKPTGSISASIQGSNGNGNNYDNDILSDYKIETEAISLQELESNVCTGNGSWIENRVNSNARILIDLTLKTRILSDSKIIIKITNDIFARTGDSIQCAINPPNNPEEAQNCASSTTENTPTGTILQLTKLCSPEPCPTGTQISITIPRGFTTPSSSTPSLSITTLSPSSHPIDECSIPLTQAVQTPIATVDSVSLSSEKVGMDTSLKISASFDFSTLSTDFVSMEFSERFLIKGEEDVECGKVDSDGEVVGVVECTSIPNPDDETDQEEISSLEIKEVLENCEQDCKVEVLVKGLRNLLVPQEYEGVLRFEVRDEDGNSIADSTYDLSQLSGLKESDLKDASVERSSLKPGASSDLKVYFKTSGVILKGSLIKIDLPINQINLDGSEFKCIDSSTDTELSCTTLSTSPTHYSLTIPSWKCTSENCPPDHPFNLTISSSQNPLDPPSTPTPFSISILSPSSTPLATTTVLPTTPLCIPSISPFKITHLAQHALTNRTKYIISFTVGEQVPAGAKIVLSFPEGRIRKNGEVFVVKSGAGFGDIESAGAVYEDDEWLVGVELDEFCIDGCDAGDFEVMIAQGIKNPEGGFEGSGDFGVEIRDSEGAMLGRGTNSDVSFQKPNLLEASLSRSTNVVRQKVDLTVKFSLNAGIDPPSLPEYDKVILKVPKAAMDKHQEFTCSKEGNPDLGCQDLTDEQPDTEYYVVQINGLFLVDGSNDGSLVHYEFVVQGFRNPQSLEANGVMTSCQLITTTVDLDSIDAIFSDYKFDEDLVLGVMNEYSVIHLNQHSLTLATQYMISFKTYSEIPAGGKIIIKFPEGRLMKIPDQDVAIQTESSEETEILEIDYTYDSTGSSLTKVIITNLCPTTCPPQSFQFKISSGIQNPNLPYPTDGSFTTITTDSTSLPIDQSTSSSLSIPFFTPTPFPSPPLQNTMTRNTSFAHAEVSLTVSLSPSSGGWSSVMKEQGKVVVKVPKKVVVRDSEVMCVAGGEELECERRMDGEYEVVIVEGVCERRSEDCESGGVVEFVIRGYRNPAVGAYGSDGVSCEVLIADNELYYQERSYLSYSPNVNLEIEQFASYDIRPLENSYISDSAEYVISFDTTIKIPANGKIIFTFPEQRIFKDSSSTLIVRNEENLEYTPSEDEVHYDDTGTWLTKIELTSQCISACNIGSFSFNISGGIKNPYYVPSSTDEFITETTDSSGAVINYGIIQNSAVFPILPTMMTDLISVSRSNDLLDTAVTLTVKFKPPETIPRDAKILIGIPHDQINPTGTSLICKKRDSSKEHNCSDEIIGDQFVVTIDKWCLESKETCTLNDPLSFDIEGYKNPNSFIANNATTSWKISITTDNSNLIDFKETAIKPSPDLHGIPPIIQLVSLSDSMINAETTILFNLFLSESLRESSTITFKFPKQFAKIPSQEECNEIPPLSRSLSCQYTQDKDGYIDTVTITLDCNSPNCITSANRAFLINIRNRGTTRAVGGDFTFTTRTASKDFGLAVYENTLIHSPSPLIFASIMNYNQTPGSEAQTDFLFRNSSEIPQYSKINIYLPPEVGFNRAHCSDSEYIKAIVFGNSMTGSCVVDGSSNNKIIISGLFDSAITETTNQEIRVTLNNMINPQQHLIKSGNFNISISDQDGNLIDVLTYDANICSSYVQSMTVEKLDVSNKTVDSTFFLSFYDETVKEYENCTLRIILPPEVVQSQDSKFNFIDDFGFSSEKEILPYDPNLGILIVTGFEQSVHVFEIGPLKNPLGAITVYWRFEIYDSGNLEICKTEGLNHTTTINTFEITRNGPKTVAQTSNCTVKFSPASRFLNNSIVSLILPFQQINYDSSTKVQISSDELSASFSDLNETHFKVEIKNVCREAEECAENTLFELELVNAINPGWICPLNERSAVSTLNPRLAGIPTIDELVTFVEVGNELAEGSLGNLQIRKELSDVVGQETLYNVSFTTVTDIPKGGFIVIEFEKGTVYKSTSEVICKRNGIVTDLKCEVVNETDGNILNINITNACPEGCESNTYFDITIEKVYNPSSIKTDNKNVTVRTMTSQNCPIDSSNFTIPRSITSGSFTIIEKVHPLTIKANKLENYTFTIQPLNPIPHPQGSLTITFPTNFTLSPTCSITSTSSSPSGPFSSFSSFTTTPSPASFTIKFSLQIEAGSTLTVNLTECIRNPMPFKPSGEYPTLEDAKSPVVFKSEVKNDTGVESTIDYDNESVKIYTDDYGDLNSVSVNRVSTVDGNGDGMNEEVDINITFNNSMPITLRSQIFIYIPRDQFELTGEDLSAIQHSPIGIGRQPIVEFLFYGSSDCKYVELRFSEFCAAEGENTFCQENIITNLTIKGFKNSHKPGKGLNSFKVFIGATASKSESKEEGIFAYPPIKARSLEQPSINRSSNVVAASTSLTIGFNLQNEIQESNGVYFLFEPPEEFLFEDSNFSCFFDQSDVTSGCLVEYNDTSWYAKQVNWIRVPIDCSLGSCPIGEHKVTISGLRNPFTNKILEGVISLKTQSKYGSEYVTYDSVNYSLEIGSEGDHLRNLIPNTCSATIERSSVEPYDPVELAVNVRTTKKISCNSFIRIMLPYSEFLRTGERIIYKKRSESGRVMKIYPVHDGSTVDRLWVEFPEFCCANSDTLEEPGYCEEGSNMSIIIPQGFRNRNAVQEKLAKSFIVMIMDSTRENTLETYTKFREKDSLTATQVDVTSITVALENPFIGFSGYMDISAIHGFTVIQSDQIVIYFEAESELKSDNELYCSRIIDGVASNISCIPSFNSDEYLVKLIVDVHCPCEKMSLYTFRIHNIHDYLKFSGNMKYEIRVCDQTQLSVLENEEDGCFSKGVGSGSLNEGISLTAGDLSEVNIERSNNVQGESSDLKISFKTLGIIPEESKVKIELPFNQIQPEGSSFTCFDSLNDNPIVCNTFKEDSLGYNYVIIQDWDCIADGCEANKDFQITIKSSKNPITSVPYPDPLVISFFISSDTLLFSSSSEINASSQLEVGKFDIHNITHNTPQYSSTTEYIIFFKPGPDSEIQVNDRVVFTFPANRVLKSDSSLLLKREFIITNVDESYEFKISEGIKNPDSSYNYEGYFITEVFDSSEKVLYRNMTKSSDLKTLQPQQIAACIKKSIDEPEEETVLIVKIKDDTHDSDTNNILENQKVLVKIPISQVIIDSAITCHQGDCSQSVICYLETSEEYHTITLLNLDTNHNEKCTFRTPDLIINGLKNPSSSTTADTSPWSVLIADSNSKIIKGASNITPVLSTPTDAPSIEKCYFCCIDSSC